MKHLTDNELLKQTKILVQKERELLMEVLEHLREIYERKLFAELGYKSLFEFAVKHLGYLEDQSYRRINAMKLLRQVPGLEGKIQSGELHLSHIGIAQNLFQQEAKAANPFSVEQKQEVFNKIAGTYSREAEKIALQMSSKPESLRPERVKTISETSSSLQMTVSNQTLEKIETLKGWLAHKYPGMTTGELFEKLCEVGIKEFNPSKPVHRKAVPVESSKSNSSKSAPPDLPVANKHTSHDDFRCHLPASVRRLVFARTNNQCENCKSEHFLEIDHRIPFALGGTNDIDNLRVQCWSCNQRAAINALGKEKIMTEASRDSFKHKSSHEQTETETETESTTATGSGLEANQNAELHKFNFLSRDAKEDMRQQALKNSILFV